MPQRPKRLEPERSDRHRFGAELRHWRLLRGLSQPRLGAKVHVSGDLIGKIEKADRTCAPELARALDEVLDTGGVLTRALPRTASDADNCLADADSPAPYGGSGPAPAAPPAIPAADGTASADWLRLPCRTADGRIVFVAVPGPGTRGPLAAESTPAGTPAPSVKDFLAVDGHPVGRLRELRRTLVRCDNVLGAGHVYDTARDHLRLISRLVRQAAGADRRALLHVQAEYAELCGWLCQDGGAEQTARFWTDRALEWAHAARQREAVTYVLVRKAQLAADRGDPVDTADLAEAAGELAPEGSRFAVMGALSTAYAHALGREATLCHRAFDRALGLLGRVSDEPSVRRGNWLDSPHVQAQRAHALSLLGEHGSAADGFDRALRTLPPTYRRDRGYILAGSALAHLRADEPELAALAGLHALPIAAATGSARTFRALSALDGLLPAATATPHVQDYREAFDATVLHEA